MSVNCSKLLVLNRIMCFGQNTKVTVSIEAPKTREDLTGDNCSLANVRT